MLTKRDGKIIAAGLVMFGSLFNFLGKIFGPDRILWESPTFFGGMSETLGWLLLLLAPIVYVVIDWKNLFPPKNKKF